MLKQQFILLFIVLGFAWGSYAGFRHELKRGERRIMTKEMRATIHLLTCVQWIFFLIIVLLGWDSFLGSPEEPGIILGTLILLLVAVPLLIIFGDALLFHYIKQRRD